MCPPSCVSSREPLSVPYCLLEHVNLAHSELIMALEPCPTGTALTWVGIREDHAFDGKARQFLESANEQNLDRLVAMPEVFATGFLVGLLEWACIKAINPHLDWPNEQTVGTHIDVSHEAATPPGLEAAATVELIAVEGKKLIFAVEAHDGIDVVSRGRHERFVINKDKFDARLGSKAAGA